jgi:hypothetical protein
MRPVRFFIALLLGLVIFSFAAKLLLMVLIGLAGLAIVAFVSKSLFKLIMTAGMRHDDSYSHPGFQMGRHNRYYDATPIDPYSRMEYESYSAHRTIEVL